MHSKQITIRNVSPDLADKLREIAKIRGESVNTTILFLLRQVLDVSEKRKRLEAYVNWDDKDQADFEKTLREQRVIDESLWK